MRSADTHGCTRIAWTPESVSDQRKKRHGTRLRAQEFDIRLLASSFINRSFRHELVTSRSTAAKIGCKKRRWKILNEMDMQPWRKTARMEMLGKVIKNQMTEKMITGLTIIDAFNFWKVRKSGKRIFQKDCRSRASSRDSVKDWQLIKYR